MERISKVIEFLNEYFNEEKVQTFFTRNLVNDSMENIYSHNGIYIDYCAGWDYIEVFGLTEQEQLYLISQGFNDRL